MATVVTTAEGAANARSGSAIDGPAPTRLVSLDAFRGVTIAGMLLVNNPGSWSSIYAPLRHATWHGWTPTDLIFPFFLFIVGVAMTFSFAARSERGDGRNALMLNATRRAAILFGLGLLLHGFPNYLDLAGLRIPGVLQRIALAYFAATAIVLYLGRNVQVIATAMLLLGYWAAMMLVPVPGGAAGVLEPGLDLGAYIDRAVFGTAHLWSQSRTWDPEGLFSTLPAVATVLLGVFAGSWLRSDRSPATKAVGLFIAGNVGVVLGLMWHPLFPINKPLWTSSYVLFTGGMACHFLAMCYWLIDVKGYKRWAFPLKVIGMNAITAYVLSHVISFPRLSESIVYGLEQYMPAIYPAITSMAGFGILYALLWYMYRNGTFVRV